MKSTFGNAGSLALLLISFSAGAEVRTDRPSPDQKWAAKKAWFAAHVGADDELREKSAIQPGDRAADLVDRLEVETLEQIDQRHLTASQLDESPWSDTYWPLYQGELAQRYADPRFPGDGSFGDLQAYVRNASCSVDNLSPAEKYDLLVGDSHKTLTESMLQEGARRMDSSGAIETWMGICHGWAPASYSTSRPVHSAEVVAADGHTKIRFYPSDIKALASALWAGANFPTRYIGGRCNEKDPARDAQGRVINNDCLDTNPASWHLAIVNQIGVSRRSFVMDANWDYEVWNQPVYGYSTRYFNPVTLEEFATAAEATVQTADDPSDPRARYRSPGTLKLVGVSMTVAYVAETNPSHSLTDAAIKDRVVSVNYRYTLELDASGKLLGGEWENDEHPDFLWTPALGAQAMAPGDHGLDSSGTHWDGSAPVPSEWRAAARASSAQNLPLGHVVNGLVGLSRL